MSFSCLPSHSHSFQHDGRRCLEGVFFCLYPLCILCQLRHFRSLCRLFAPSNRPFRATVFFQLITLSQSSKVFSQGSKTLSAAGGLPPSFSFFWCLFLSFPSLIFHSLFFQHNGKGVQVSKKKTWRLFFFFGQFRWTN